MYVENFIKNLEVYCIIFYIEILFIEYWFIVLIDFKEMIYGLLFVECNIVFYIDDFVYIYLLEDYVWYDVLVNWFVWRN